MVFVIFCFSEHSVIQKSAQFEAARNIFITLHNFSCLLELCMLQIHNIEIGNRAYFKINCVCTYTSVYKKAVSMMRVPTCSLSRARTHNELVLRMPRHVLPRCRQHARNAHNSRCRATAPISLNSSSARSEAHATVCARSRRIWTPVLQRASRRSSASCLGFMAPCRH